MSSSSKQLQLGWWCCRERHALRPRHRSRRCRRVADQWSPRSTALDSSTGNDDIQHNRSSAIARDISLVRCQVAARERWLIAKTVRNFRIICSHWRMWDYVTVPNSGRVGHGQRDIKGGVDYSIPAPVGGVEQRCNQTLHWRLQRPSHLKVSCILSVYCSVDVSLFMNFSKYSERIISQTLLWHTAGLVDPPVCETVLYQVYKSQTLLTRRDVGLPWNPRSSPLRRGLRKTQPHARASIALGDSTGSPRPIHNYTHIHISVGLSLTTPGIMCLDMFVKKAHLKSITQPVLVCCMLYGLLSTILASTTSKLVKAARKQWKLQSNWTTEHLIVCVITKLIKTLDSTYYYKYWSTSSGDTRTSFSSHTKNHVVVKTTITNVLTKNGANMANDNGPIMDILY